MEKNVGWLWTLLAVLIAINLIGWVMIPDSVDEQALSDKVTAQVISQIPTPEKMPTAAEVAALVPKVEIPEFSVPEFVVPEFKDHEMVKDLWEARWADDIEELETEAYDVAELELEDRDYKLLTKWLEESIEGFDELEDVDNYDFDDCEINIIELGLDEDEDKVVEVVCELKVEYSLLEGVAQDWKKTVFSTATVSFDEGDFDDEDVELVFA